MASNAELGEVWLSASDGALWHVLEEPDEVGLVRAVNMETAVQKRLRIAPGRYWRRHA